MSSEIEQHKAIHSALERFLASIALAKADLSAFDARKLEESLVGMKEPLVCRNICESAHAILADRRCNL